MVNDYNGPFIIKIHDCYRWARTDEDIKKYDDILEIKTGKKRSFTNDPYIEVKLFTVSNVESRDSCTCKYETGNAFNIENIKNSIVNFIKDNTSLLEELMNRIKNNHNIKFYIHFNNKMDDDNKPAINFEFIRHDFELEQNAFIMGAANFGTFYIYEDKNING